MSLLLAVIAAFVLFVVVVELMHWYGYYRLSLALAIVVLFVALWLFHG